MIASLAPRNFDDARRLAALVPAEANAIEWRLDLAPGDIPPRALLDLDPRCGIVTYRTAREGGRFDGTLDEYRRAARSAWEAGAVVDVEIESGLLGDRSFLPDRRRVIGSRHGSALSNERAAACLALDVAAVKLVVTDPETVAEAVACVDRARRLGAARPVACFATGSRGVVSRALGLRMGSALSYGSVEGETGAGQIPVADLVRLSGGGGAPERIFAVYGGDVSGSLSPEIHNALFRRRGRPWIYVPLTASRRGASVESPIAADLIALDGLSKNLYGVSVTNPFKGETGGVAEPDADVARIRAANTLVRRTPACLDMTSHNTDVRAVREVLDRLGGRRVIVVGTGGAARAAVAAAGGAGREVAVAGRSAAKATALAEELGAAAIAWADLASSEADVWVNATPLGAGDDDPLPVPPRAIGPASAVVDFVYRRRGETPLVHEARARGARFADGLELLARQAAGQAHLFGIPDATFAEIDAILRRGRGAQDREAPAAEGAPA